jgi:hypothetical protein
MIRISCPTGNVNDTKIYLIDNYGKVLGELDYVNKLTVHPLEADHSVKATITFSRVIIDDLLVTETEPYLSMPAVDMQPTKLTKIKNILAKQISAESKVEVIQELFKRDGVAP